MVDLLLIVPHPDDEVFGCGGTFARMSAHGRRVATLTLTRGGAGRTLGLCEQASLPERREAELRASLAALGVADIHLFDYPDFVTEAGRGLDARPGLAGVPETELTGRIAELIDRLEPGAVLTFGPNGSNGHPDHVTTHQRVLEALAVADHAPRSLYYFASDAPYDGDVRPGFLKPDEIRRLHLPPTHYVDVDVFIEPKLRAMGHHETQARSVLMFMRRLTRRLVVESFHLARPKQATTEGARTVLWLS